MPILSTPPRKCNAMTENSSAQNLPTKPVCLRFQVCFCLYLPLVVRVIDPLIHCLCAEGREGESAAGAILWARLWRQLHPMALALREMGGVCLVRCHGLLYCGCSALASSLTWCVQCGVQKGIGGEAAFSPQIGQRS